MIIKNKKRVEIQFKIFLNQCMSSRILITTDAYELDIDDSDVKRIIQ